jgi:hypothetical protein
VSSESSGARGRIAGFLRRAATWAESAWVAYPAIALFQLKVLWGAWIYRDLTQGDTASSFQRGLLWHQYGKVDLIWSPLYTAFYGSCFGITGDVYAATILHRVLIVILVALLVLALFRRLVSPGIAWLAAAWWAVIPYNFDVFEVHLFAILPLIAVPLAVLVWPGPRGRGIALAVMVGASVLVRNEMAVVAALLAALFFVWETRYAARFEEGAPFPLRTYGVAYGAPVVVSGALVLFFVTRSVMPLSLLPRAYEPKHTINMCQAYAFGYKQRHPEWTKDHWTECSELMRARFGEPYPALSTMIVRNPQAVLGHFAWNLRLLPGGTQLSLFAAMSGNVTPDYSPVPVWRRRALLGSTILAALIAAGVFVSARRRSTEVHRSAGQRMIGWLTIVPAAAVALFLIVPTQRPRPEYLYGLSLPIVATAAWAADTLLRRFGLSDPFGLLTPVVMVCALLAAPRYYVPPAGAPSVRPLLETVLRLKPFQALISDPGTIFAAGQHSFSLRRYLVTLDPASYAHGILRPQAEWMSQRGLAPKVIGPLELGQLREDQPVSEFLAQRDVNLIYLDEEACRRFRSTPLHRDFLERPDASKWRKLAGGTSGAGEWTLLAGLATPGLQ